jgi:hypothetical protein
MLPEAMEVSKITGAFQAALHYIASPDTEGLLWSALMGLHSTARHRFQTSILRIRGYPVAQVADDILVLYIVLFQCINTRFPEKKDLYIFLGKKVSRKKRAFLK